MLMMLTPLLMHHSLGIMMLAVTVLLYYCTLPRSRAQVKT